MEGDWKQNAADRVLANLSQRRGIGHELRRIESDDDETWQEIRRTVAGIIRRSVLRRFD